VAALLNQTSNLRFRLDLARRLSDGVVSPASLEMQAAVERYRHEPQLGFVPFLLVERATLLDLDLIQFLESLEAMLDHADRREAPETALLEASVEPTIGLRIGGGPDAFQVEVGIDLQHVLEPVAGLRGERGADLALVRFFANGRAVLAFCDALLEEFARFPTDPAKVAKGSPS
jgi:hypothetical protein